jgi:hypothetical protein
MYKLIVIDGVLVNIKWTNGAIEMLMPIDETNTDYQQYLAWLAEGNTPQEADDAIN